MELTEHLLQLSRRAEEQAQELRVTVARIVDLDVRVGRRSIHAELIRAGLAENTDYGHGTAWSACNRIIDQRNQMSRLIAEFQAEAEILTSIADDLIGTTGRLI